VARHRADLKVQGVDSPHNTQCRASCRPMDAVVTDVSNACTVLINLLQSTLSIFLACEEQWTNAAKAQGAICMKTLLGRLLPSDSKAMAASMAVLGAFMPAG
jgi:hypothetical protein